MSLYTMDEICEGCIHANWHPCCNTYCCCDLGITDVASQYVDHMDGTCKKKDTGEENE